MKYFPHTDILVSEVLLNCDRLLVRCSSSCLLNFAKSVITCANVIIIHWDVESETPFTVVLVEHIL